MKSKALIAICTTALMVCKAAAATTVITELEPNDTFATAQAVGPHDGLIDIIGFREFGGAGNFGLGAANDFYRFTGTAGDMITIEVIDTGGGTLFDSTLALFDSGGTELAFNDDSPLANSPAGSFLSYTFGTTGTFAIGIGGFLEDDTFGYRAEIRGLSPVPLPASAALLLAGLGAFALARRRVSRT